MSLDPNRLRAGVLGANDGVISVAGIVTLVAGATTSRGAVLLAGFGGLAAGAVSMAIGEFLSVSAQRDEELTAGDDAPASPSAAAAASFLSFICGAAFPLLAIALPPASLRVPFCFVVVLLTLAFTGTVSARLAGSAAWPAVRLFVGLGAVGMAVTYTTGLLA